MASNIRLSDSDYKKYTKWLFIFAIVIRMFFALKGIFCITDHDIGIIDTATLQLNDVGHLAYVNYLISHHAFPPIDLDFTGYPPQFYHPPLFYIFAALVKVLVNAVGGSDVIAYEVIQQINMLFSCIGLWVCSLIMDEFELSTRGKFIGTLLCGFNPIFIIIGVELNNDCLMTMFCLLALFFTIRWYKNSSWKNIMLIMLFLVLGMLSKTSAVLIAPAIGTVFLYKLITSKADVKKLIPEFIVFGFTSIPLGLSWVIRNYLLYKVPFNYVPELSLGSEQYLGDFSPISRLLLPSVKQLTSIGTELSDAANYKNIWGQMFTTMVFDEGILYTPDPVTPRLLLWSTILMYLVVFYAFVRYLFSKEQLVYRLALGVAHFVLLGMFVSFAFQYPHICSVHYRYIVTAFVVMVIGALKFAQNKEKHQTIIEILAALSSLLCVVVYVLY